jgi:hypothetical protein
MVGEILLVVVLHGDGLLTMVGDSLRPQTRRLRSLDAARTYAAGDYPAADHDVRRRQGCGRIAVRLLRSPLRRRCARTVIAWPDLLRRLAGRKSPVQ